MPLWKIPLQFSCKAPLQGAKRCYEVSLEPSLLQAEQTQLFQPVSTGEVLQASDHLHRPPLDSRYPPCIWFLSRAVVVWLCLHHWKRSLSFVVIPKNQLPLWASAACVCLFPASVDPGVPGSVLGGECDWHALSWPHCSWFALIPAQESSLQGA